jgi:hypothetical protein
MRPKPPPKYRILVMMATNLPEALDEALLRPGRIDRIYKVGYPSKAGRVRTYHGYLDKVKHQLTDEQVDKLATITPYATGATIKDMVNEALITAIRAGRDTITWRDIVRAKQLKELGPAENVEYIERERHAVAVHEACHAVVAYRTADRRLGVRGRPFHRRDRGLPPGGAGRPSQAHRAGRAAAVPGAAGAGRAQRRFVHRPTGDLASAGARSRLIERWGRTTINTHIFGAILRPNGTYPGVPGGA